MTVPPLIPFFQGSLDQIKEVQEFCRAHGFEAVPTAPPGGCGSS